MVAAFAEIFQVSFLFTYLEDGLQWLGRIFDPDFTMSEEELLLGHVLFALVGLNKDFLGHDVCSDGLVLGRAQGPANLLFWAGPHNSPSKLRFLISFRGEKRGFDFTKDGTS